MRRSVLVLVLRSRSRRPGRPPRSAPGRPASRPGAPRSTSGARAASGARLESGGAFVGGVLSADVGLAVSPLDEGYGSLTAGLEVLPFPRAVVSPFARAEAGVLGEPEYSGYVAGGGGGLAVRLSDRLSLRGGATWGTHGNVKGPVVYYGGLELRW